MGDCSFPCFLNRMYCKQPVAVRELAGKPFIYLKGKEEGRRIVTQNSPVEGAGVFLVLRG